MYLSKMQNTSCSPSHSLLFIFDSCKADFMTETTGASHGRRRSGVGRDDGVPGLERKNVRVFRRAFPLPLTLFWPASHKLNP